MRIRVLSPKRGSLKKLGFGILGILLFFYHPVEAQLVISIKEKISTDFMTAKSPKRKQEGSGIRVVFFNVSTQRVETVAYISLGQKNPTGRSRVIKLPFGCQLIKAQDGSMSVEVDKAKDKEPWILCPRTYLTPTLTAQREASFVSYKGDSLVLLRGKGKSFLDEKNLFPFLKRFNNRRTEIHKKLTALIIDETGDKKSSLGVQRQTISFDELLNYQDELKELGRCVTEITFWTFGFRQIDPKNPVGVFKLTLFMPSHFFQGRDRSLTEKDSLWIASADGCFSCQHTIDQIRLEAREVLKKGGFFKKTDPKPLVQSISLFEKEKPDSIFLLKQRILRDGGVESTCERAHLYGFIMKLSSQLNSYLGSWDCNGWFKGHFSQTKKAENHNQKSNLSSRSLKPSKSKGRPE